VNVNIQITPRITPKGPQKEKILNGIQSFLKNFPVIIDEYERRTVHLARKAAPFRTGGLSQGIDSINYGREGFGLISSPVDTYGDEDDDGWKIGSKARGIMMEFGYPYHNYWGPYLPNPRPGTKTEGSYSGTSYDLKTGTKKSFKKARRKGLEEFYGLGYMRISYIVAARSLHQQKVSYSTSGLSLTDVKSYVKRSEDEFTLSLRKLLLKYLRNEGLPPYLKRKSVPKTAAPVRLASNTAYGDVSGLNLNIPIEIEGESMFNALRTGNNLRGVSKSLLKGSPFADGYSFATDDSNLPFLPF
jgi:hypothetical protein